MEERVLLQSNCSLYRVTTNDYIPNLMRDIRLGSENESMRRVRGIICGNGWR